ncbi:MAG: hypothetical protein AAB019_06295, partial [Planctomycetota bacterium]
MENLIVLGLADLVFQTSPVQVKILFQRQEPFDQLDQITPFRLFNRLFNPNPFTLLFYLKSFFQKNST